MPGYSRVVECGEHHVHMSVLGELEGECHAGGMLADADAAVAGDGGDGETIQVEKGHVHGLVDSAPLMGSMSHPLE